MSSSYGAALSGLGATASIFSPALDVPRPGGTVVPRDQIQTYQQARDYALAAYHATAALAAKIGETAGLIGAANQYFNVAYYAKMSVAELTDEFGPTVDPLVTFKALLLAADRTVDGERARAAPTAPLPSNVTRLPVAQTPPVVPTRVSTAGIGTAKGAAIALGVGLIAWLALRKKKK